MVLPVKGGPGAKSRLGGPAAPRAALATAVALDCLDAVLAASRTAAAHVVTADPQVAARARDAGGRVVAESCPGAGLLAAVGDGVRAAAQAGGPVAVLLADLPCLRPRVLDDALAAVEGALARGAASVLVPDAEGTGTVLLAAADAERLHPRFGAGSAAAHAAAGALRLDLDAPRLRRDVDTPGELAQAQRLGVGPRTAAALAGSPPLAGSPGPAGGAGLRPRPGPARCPG
ncbi:2-phospho-L-lactate guanylyltransferase [Quadrisphaera sp. DSM 44207]|uniref:2-phospho-L-lactate guanylyltransferase n=1 Tax=Quadrisphaera sp. DSM 44207 TaxID=1881057 RepID=UPI00350E9FEC